MPPQQTLPGGRTQQPTAPALPTPAAGQRPASWDDLIRAVSKQHGVNPLLASAMVREELGDRPPDPTMDPLKFITPLVTDLSKMSTRYQGDVQKMLMARWGGETSVDSGTMSTGARAYAANVIARMSADLRQTQAGGAGGGQPAPVAAAASTPAAGRGTAATNIGTTARENAYTFGQAYDPRDPTGRQNIAATAGSIGTAMLTRGLPIGSLVTRIAQTLLPAMGAAVGGAGERAVEETIGTVPSTPGSVTTAGLTQGAYDLAGQAFLWPIRRIFRSFIAPGVASRAADKLKEEKISTLARGRDMVDSVRDQVADVVRTTRAAGQTAIDATRSDAAESVAKAKRFATERLAQTELETGANLAAIHKTYDDLLSQTPSTLAAGAAVKQTLDGPTKRALDLAGQRVNEAAQTGPMVEFASIRSALNDMAAKLRPDILFGKKESATAGIGFLANIRSAANPQGAAATIDPNSNLGKLIAQQLGISPEKMHPELPGLLGKIASVDLDHIPFADAHRIKMLLDESVNWDRTAKKQLEKITKGLRVALRDAMTGHAPYDQATAAYQAIVPLYRKGVGKRIIQLADTPDGATKLARMLVGKDAAQAATLKQLLVDQSAAGGDPALGHRAWDMVRSAYTHESLIAGGIDKIEKHLDDLVTLRPEFMRTVYGDPAGQQILTNLANLSQAYTQAVAAKAARESAVKDLGKAGVEEAKAVASGATTTVRRDAAAAVDAAQRTGQQTVRTEQRAANEANARVRAKIDQFKQSSVSKFTRKDVADIGAHVGRAGALGFHSYWGIDSMLRLLKSPSAADLIEWAAYSPRNTQRMIEIMSKPGPPEVAAALMREMGSALGLAPQSSH